MTAPSFPARIDSNRMNRNANTLDTMLEDILPYIPPDGEYRAFKRYLFIRRNTDGNPDTTADIQSDKESNNSDPHRSPVGGATRGANNTDHVTTTGATDADPNPGRTKADDKR